jgi:multiple sugar transport system permease protein
VSEIVRTRRVKTTLSPYLFIVVPLAYMILIIFWPAVREIWISFTNTQVTAPNGGSFVGIVNYVSVIAGGQLWQTLLTTVLYVGGTVIGSVLLGTMGAVLVDRRFRGRAVARTIMAFGWAVPPVATSLIWTWIFNQQTGVLNEFLGTFGIPPQAWLSSQALALPSVIATTIWQYAPFVMLVMLAALQSVPEEVREAARVDGAKPLSVFRAVTFPHILPAMRLVALLVIVWSIRLFEIIYLLTAGGPVNSTSTLVVSLEQAAFQGLSLGTAATYGVIGLIISLIVAVIYFLFERRDAQRIRS